MERMLEEMVRDLLGAAPDDQTLRAVEGWRRAWRREWERVESFDLGDEDLPAPLWCWPP